VCYVLLIVVFCLDVDPFFFFYCSLAGCFFLYLSIYLNKPNHPIDCLSWLSSRNEEISRGAIMGARSLGLVNRMKTHMYIRL
jgi:hypothetical protein